MTLADAQRVKFQPIIGRQVVWMLGYHFSEDSIILLHGRARALCRRAGTNKGSGSGVAMFLKAPRWLLTLEAILLLGAILGLAYKAALWIQPLSGLDQTPHGRKIDPQTQILQYYRQFPDRYIRVTKETWQYVDVSRTAFHSFTLKNSATVAYQEIEIRFSYESSGGKVLNAQVIKMPGILAGLGTLRFEKFKVKNVPNSAINAVLTVVNARM